MKKIFSALLPILTVFAKVLKLNSQMQGPLQGPALTKLFPRNDKYLSDERRAI
jgi:hypothetical protein